MPDTRVPIPQATGTVVAAIAGDSRVYKGLSLWNDDNSDRAELVLWDGAAGDIEDDAARIFTIVSLAPGESTETDANVRGTEGSAITVEYLSGAGQVKGNVRIG